MRTALYAILLILTTAACSGHKKSEADFETGKESPMQFDKSKWSSKEGLDYPFRDQMLRDLLDNDTVRRLNDLEILELLGEPDRRTEGYFYYMVAQRRLVSWPLHTKSLVIKFSNDTTIEWMKIHK